MSSTYSKPNPKSAIGLQFNWKNDGWTVLPVIFSIITALAVIGS